jgi:restriction system protein
VAQDQILDHITKHFPRHDFARLIEAILQADGFVTQVSPPGPDGGVDILAARGILGFEGPYLCIQVKSSAKPEDVNTLRALKGTMQMFNASQGLLVAWGGFTRAVQREARQSFFTVRLWSATDVLDAIYRVYDRLPEEVQAELPLKRVWALVLDEASG